jgi:hypothetical protein
MGSGDSCRGRCIGDHTPLLTTLSPARSTILVVAPAEFPAAELMGWVVIGSGFQQSLRVQIRPRLRVWIAWDSGKDLPFLFHERAASGALRWAAQGGGD